MIKRLALAVLLVVITALVVNRVTMMTLKITGTCDGNVLIQSGIGVDRYTYSTH